MAIDVRRLLNEIERLSRTSLAPASSRAKVSLDYTVQTERASDGRVTEVAVRYNALDVLIVCTISELIVVQEDKQPRLFRWEELPTKVAIDVERLAQALYESRNELVRLPLGERGEWSDLCVPGWFAVQLYNALRSAGLQSSG